MSKNLPNYRRIAARSLLVIAAGVTLSALAAPAQGADISWWGTGSNFWTNGANWFGTNQPTAADRALFSRADPFIIRGTPLLDADRTVAAMTVEGNHFAVGPYTFSQNNGATLTVTGQTIFGSAGAGAWTSTFDGFRLNTNTLRLTEAGTLALSGGANVTSAGLVTLAGTGNKLIVNNGTLNAAGGITLANGTTLQVDASGTLNMNTGTTLSLNGSTSLLKLNKGYGFGAGTTINVSPGSDILGSSYIDIGNGGATTVNLDGTDSLLQALGSTVSDWGATANGSAVVNLTNSAVADMQKLNIAAGTGAASINVNSSAGLNVGQLLTMGGGASGRFIGMSINGGIVDCFSTATFNAFADVNLIAGTLRFRGPTSVNSLARIDITGGTLDTTGQTLTINGGTLTKTTSGVLSNGSTLRVQAGGTATISNFFDIANGVASGGLVVTGAGSTYSSTGLSDWGRSVGNTATVSIDTGGVATLGGLRIGNNGGAANVTVASGGILKPSTLEVGGLSNARTVNLTINGGTLQVTDPNSSTTFNDKAVLNLQSGTFDPKGQVTFFTGSTANWSGGSFLMGSGKVLTVSGGTINRTITSAGGLSPAATLLVNSGGDFESAGSYTVGEFGAGTVTLTGTNSRLRTLTDLTLGGTSAGQVGTLTTTAGGGLVVGDSGSGFNANVLVVGDANSPSANAGGKLTIRNGSVLNHHFDAVIAPFTNTFGTAIVTGASSRFDVGESLYVGNAGGSVADVQVLGGGRVGADYMTVANAAQSNATVTVSGTDSLLAVGTNLDIGRFGTGTLNINSGGNVTATIATAGYFGGGVGTINLSGAGSQLAVADTLIVGNDGTGTVNLSGGTLKAPNILRNTSGTFNFTGGRLETNTYTGSLTQDGGTFALAGLNTATETTVTSNYTINSGTVEVHLGANNDTRLIATNAASLNGGNLAISIADYIPVLGDNVPILTTSSLSGHFATVSGVSISPTRSFAITYTPTQVRYVVAIPGDATLSNGVGFPDLVILAQNYNQGGRQWVTGDFNGTGVTDFADLVILAQHYNQTGLDLPDGASGGFASDWALAQSLVPEPTALLVMPVLMTVTRRRAR